MRLKFGILWSFRNPAFARMPWPELYRSHLDLCVESEALGYDNIWLTEHHFVDDGYSPALAPSVMTVRLSVAVNSSACAAMRASRALRSSSRRRNSAILPGVAGSASLRGIR